MAYNLPQQTIHVDVRLSPDDRKRAMGELQRAKQLLEQSKMGSIAAVVAQLLSSLKTPVEELGFEPMPEAPPEEVIVSFRTTGKYNEAFLESLERGLKEIASTA